MVSKYSLLEYIIAANSISQNNLGCSECLISKWNKASFWGLCAMCARNAHKRSATMVKRYVWRKPARGMR